MANENLGWLFALGSVGLMLYVGTVINWYFARFEIIQISKRLIVTGALFVLGYVMYAGSISPASAIDLALLKVPFTEVKRAISNRSIPPLHLFGYIMLFIGIGLIPLPILFGNKRV